MTTGRPTREEEVATSTRPFTAEEVERFGALSRDESIAEGGT